MPLEEYTDPDDFLDWPVEGLGDYAGGADEAFAFHLYRGPTKKKVTVIPYLSRRQVKGQWTWVTNYAQFPGWTRPEDLLIQFRRTVGVMEASPHRVKFDTLKNMQKRLSVLRCAGAVGPVQKFSNLGDPVGRVKIDATLEGVFGIRQETFQYRDRGTWRSPYYHRT